MSPSLVSRTNISYDIDELNFIRNHMTVEWYNKNQTGLQYATFVNNSNVYTQSCGSYTQRILPMSNFAGHEEDFIHIIPDYKNTLYETLIQEQNAYRTRILCRPKQTCYTIHTDVTNERYHLALETNSQCYVVYPESSQLFHIPADGYVYRMVTNVPHTVMNCGPDRYHLTWGSHI